MSAIAIGETRIMVDTIFEIGFIFKLKAAISEAFRLLFYEAYEINLNLPVLLYRNEGNGSKRTPSWVYR